MSEREVAEAFLNECWYPVEIKKTRGKYVARVPTLGLRGFRTEGDSPVEAVTKLAEEWPEALYYRMKIGSLPDPVPPDERQWLTAEYFGQLDA